MANFKFSAFADEAGKMLSEQIDAMRGSGIGYLEMRGVNGTNVADLTPAEARAIRAELDAAEIAVWSLGSPIGKIKLADPFAPELDRFKRLLETADITGAKRIRMFSFYEAEAEGAVVCHAGTKLADGRYLTAGGRVLGVTAMGDDLKDAVANAYSAAKHISFENMHFRTDIGVK